MAPESEPAGAAPIIAGLLTAPYGYPTGIGVTFRAVGPVDPLRLRRTLLHFSCYPPAIPKVLHSLLYARRYDCRLMVPLVQRQFGEMVRRFADLNILFALQAEERTVWASDRKLRWETPD